MPPPRDVKLQQKCDEAKVVERDENIHSRQQRQISAILGEVRRLIREVEDLSG